MKQYLISKKSFNGDVVYLNIDDNMGYKVNPKKGLLYDGIKVNEIIFIKRDLINKIIQKKIRNRLDKYINYLIDDDDDSDSRRALGDLQRYKVFIQRKYVKFLDGKYVTLLNNKLDILERNFKTKAINSIMVNERLSNTYEEISKTGKSR